MTHRQELVALVENGTPPADIYTYFSKTLTRSDILDLLRDCGVSIPIPPMKDEITDERRKFLQELSISD